MRWIALSLINTYQQTLAHAIWPSQNKYDKLYSAEVKRGFYYKPRLYVSFKPDTAVMDATTLLYTCTDPVSTLTTSSTNAQLHS